MAENISLRSTIIVTNQIVTNKVKIFEVAVLLNLPRFSKFKIELIQNFVATAFT